MDSIGITVKSWETVKFEVCEDPILNVAPTDIQWNATDWTSGIDLPGANTVLANLTTIDPDDDSEFTYRYWRGVPNFAVSADGVVTREYRVSERHHLHVERAGNGRRWRVLHRNLQHHHRDWR